MDGILASEFRLQVIRPTLQTLNLWTMSAENLLLGTAAQESQLGHYLVQENGPGLGVYQVDPATHQDIWAHYLNSRPLLANQVRSLTASTKDGVIPDTILVTNLAYTTAIARVIYYRVAQPLPDAYDIEGLAEYWKLYYNTPLGEGEVSEFIQNYNEYIL